MAPRDKKTKLQTELTSHQLKHQPGPWPLEFPHVVGALWDLDLGHHPANKTGAVFFRAAGFLPKDANLQQFQNAALPLIPCLDGHNLVTANSLPRALEIDDKTPISPLFARDLAGRVIYLGYGPEVKTAADWQNAQGITFPRGCLDVRVEVPGAEMIENVFFTRFRTLDATPQQSYANPQHYPYKLRLDTFYQDGWRLPQTERVFARTDVATKTVKAAAADFTKRWQSRPSGQSYEDFYEANNGETWFEELFTQGCTVIPTLEAANGYNKVGSKFELEDFWPGRAVDGLHEITSWRADASPKGTILQVEEPGFVTADTVNPAKVVVSDGSGYATPHTTDPAPQLPDLRLPHQRAAANWESFWLPTHPSHFEAPALWDWDLQTGRFLQASGPLWDPLHYFYASQPLVLRAFRNPLPTNAFLAEVPEQMKTRFYPIVPMNGEDQLNYEVFAERRAMGRLPLSRADHVMTGRESAHIGYHPLPALFEYELDPFWFPELAPRNRVSAPPKDIESRLAKPVNVNGEAVTYPELARFYDEEAAAAPTAQTLFKPEISERLYRHVGADVWRTPAQHAELENMHQGLLEAATEWKESAKRWRLKRQALLKNSAAWVVLARWQGLPAAELSARAQQQVAPNSAKAA